MAIETAFDENYDPERGPQCTAGRHHVAITAVDEHGGRNGAMVVDFEILASTAKNNEGTSHREFFQQSVKAMSRIHQLAIAVGMVTAKQLKERKERNDPPVYDFADAIGRQLHIRTVEEEYNGKVNQRCNFDIYALGDPKCADWPKHEEFARAAGVAVTEKSKAARNSEQPSTAPAEPPQTIADDFLDGVV